MPIKVLHSPGHYNIIKGDGGVIVVDPLISTETAKAGREHQQTHIDTGGQTDISARWTKPRIVQGVGKSDNLGGSTIRPLERERELLA